MRISLAYLLLGVAAFSITLAVGIHNLREERLDRRMRTHRCQVIRKNAQPFTADLLGSRFGNPVIELEFCAIETSPIGIYSAVLDSELKTELKRLSNLKKIWIYTDAENFAPADIEKLMTEFPDLQLETVVEKQRFPLTPLLPSYKWYDWFKLFSLSYLFLILANVAIGNKKERCNHQRVE